MDESGVLHWEVECLRCSVFPGSNPMNQISDIWATLAENSPEEIRFQPQQQTATAEGGWENGHLRLDIRPNQLDWKIQPNLQDSSNSLPSIGSYDECRDAFVQRMLKWLKTECPATKRVAYGAILLLPRSSLVEAYETLDKLLPSVSLTSVDTTDFSYRINRTRPTSSEIEGLRINRISNWTALEIINARVQLPKNAPASVPVEVQSTVPICRLELDINTDALYSEEFEKQQIEAIFGELVLAGSEIASKGDIP